MSHTKQIVALVVLVAAAYLPVLSAGYIWDDDKHLTENVCIVGPAGFAGIWTTSEATYYPLVLTTFWVEHALWGLAPMPYHLVNLLVHAACALMLWHVLLRLRVPGAWLGAALWALHPVQVESVAWITELKNTQSGLFYLLAIWFFLRWKESRATRPYVAALIFAIAAILSKSSTVMLPLVLFLAWVWEERRLALREALPLVPFFLVSAAAGGWTIWEQQFHAGAMGADWTLSLPQRVVIAGRDIWFYLGKLVWPHPLIFIYSRWEVDATDATAYLPVVAAIAASVVLWLLRGRWGRPALFALAYFVVSLFPVLSFFNVYYFRFSYVADHFQYLASMGPSALAGAALWRALSPSGESRAPGSRRTRSA